MVYEAYLLVSRRFSQIYWQR